MANAAAPLIGRRVVAIEHAVAAPLCTRLLADLGADVIKVERPDGGDFARRYDSVARGESAYFAWLNAGKRSLTANLAAARDRAVVDDLLRDADALVHNLGPGAIERLGYGWDRLHARYPRIVSCAISGYGQDGPDRERKAFDLLIQAESGLASITGTNAEPARVGVSIADIAAGMYALAAILAAWVEREATGIGRLLDISMLEALTDWMGVPTLQQRYAGSPPPRSGLHHPSIAPYGPYATADGVSRVVAVQNEGQWARLCERVLERPDLIDDARFASNELRVRHRAQLDALIAAALARLDAPAFADRLDAADIPHTVLNDVAGLLAHPQLRARGAWRVVESAHGELVLPRSPLGSPTPVSRVPTLGQDDDELRRETAR